MGESNQGSLRTSVSPFDVCPGHSDLQMVVSTGDQLTGYTYLRPWGGCPTVRGRSEEIHRFNITTSHPGLPFRMLIFRISIPVIARVKLKLKADVLPWNFTSRSTRDRSDGAPGAG